MHRIGAIAMLNLVVKYQAPVLAVFYVQGAGQCFNANMTRDNYIMQGMLKIG